MDYSSDYEFILSNAVEHDVRTDDPGSDSRCNIRTVHANGRESRKFAECVSDLMLVSIGLASIPMVRGVDVYALDIRLCPPGYTYAQLMAGHQDLASLRSGTSLALLG